MTKQEKELSKRLVVTLGDPESGNTKEKTVIMSYGLMQVLASYFKDMDQYTNMELDFGLKSQMLNEVLDDRDEKGDRLNPDKNYAMNLTIEEGERLSSWIGEHLSDFFLSGLQKQAAAIEKLIPVLEDVQKAQEKLELKPQSNGSQD